MLSEVIIRLSLIGIGATLLMDGWSLLQKHLLGIPPLNYALPGRWILSMFRGQFVHRTILQTPPVKGERTIGWLFHYLTGMVFAVIPLLLAGAEWLDQPGLLTGLLAGLLTCAAPFLIMQPAFGFGVAAANAPNPARARLLSLLTHSVFGLGLFLAAQLTKLV
ncbi:DUF2938 family protein [Winslowiella iniecta]|uniref:Membrane protein n=1 Tax=Winslowiella iniecta TaxID=1560201 RepID=A0A0L7T6Y2_9GAMM|nr:DUF2938 family protein [Winslowiella iniecta]KOC87243.1 membrane protein [Winslowiella iniecta]KOC90946.1 membrane protein [Winslowiella iniecta]